MIDVAWFIRFIYCPQIAIKELIFCSMSLPHRKKSVLGFIARHCASLGILNYLKKLALTF